MAEPADKSFTGFDFKNWNLYPMPQIVVDLLARTRHHA